MDGKTALPAGRHQVRVEFEYDGGGVGKGVGITLYIDGKRDGEGRLDASVGYLFFPDETLYIGREAGSPVSPDYGARDNAFTGEVNWVQIDVDNAAADADHMISPEERFKLALIRE